MAIFSDGMPKRIENRIQKTASEELFGEKVYRVAKFGLDDERSFYSTFEEVKAGIIPDNGKYDWEDIGSYSTSVYLKMKPCKKYIRLYGKKLEKQYGKMSVIQGCLSNGYYQLTSHRKPDDTSGHIDWWIFNGQRLNAMKGFKCIDED